MTTEITRVQRAQAAAANKALALHKRADRLVDRILPPQRTAHGFYAPETFMAGIRYGAARRYAAWTIFALLRAKQTGERPRILVPDEPHMRDGVMASVTADLRLGIARDVMWKLVRDARVVKGEGDG